MEILKYLRENNDKLTGQWIRFVVSSYPEEAGKFLFNGKNKFSNPVGFTFSKELKTIYSELFSNPESAEITNSIENIMQIRAVQDFSPSDTIGIILKLKDIIFKEVSQFLKNPDDYEELLKIDRQIDDLAMKAVDIFVRLRERLINIRAGELKSRFGKIADRINKKYGIPDMETGENNI
jgi:hypothetical protein